MRNRHWIQLAILALTLTTSCVSKKKFTAMEAGRFRAETEVARLAEENNARAARIAAMIKDFETMKNELMGSNAAKDQLIDNLNREMASLQEKLNEQQQSLQERNFAFGFERERLSETLQEKDNTIQSLNREVNTLEKEITQQAAVLSDRNIRINTLSDQITVLEGEKIRGEEQRSELEQQLRQAQAETNRLKALGQEKDETITRLQNNVNLLKREMEGRSN
jgi:chromosome segregation ATPase